ncbi:MAG: 4-amino-4-deoxychorismate lyase [Actinomycetales bacterium]|nr:4-amino-4-deoxychorismate lyase [Actinomycetales bacterium]
MRIWIGTRSGGRLVEPPDARIDVLDHGFTVADGVFETLKATPDGPFALTRHLRRLGHSSRALGLEPPDDAVVRAAVDDVVAGADLGPDRLGRLRITYTAGTGPLGSDRGASEPTLVVALTPTTRWPVTTSVATVPWTRNERSPIAGVKSTSYAENVVALKHAHDRGLSEAVLANTRGELCEGTGSNVLVVLGNRVVTPPLSSGCLAGITRELVLEWFDVEEGTLPLDVLFEADEVLLTSSTRDVHPVVRVDEREWPTAGPVGTRMRAAFAERAAEDIDP